MPGQSVSISRMLLIGAVVALGMFASYHVGLAGGSFATLLILGALAILVVGAVSQLRATASDPTGIANEGWSQLAEELERCRRHQHPLGLIRIDRRHAARTDRPSAVDPSRLGGIVRMVDRVWADRRFVYLLLPECSRPELRGALARIQTALSGSVPTEALRVAVFPDDGLTMGAIMERLDEPGPASADQQADVVELERRRGVEHTDRAG